MTEQLILRKGTDLERWRDIDNLAVQWDSRAKLAGDIIGPEPQRVLDVGAGAMALKGFLAPGSAYFPADVSKRSEECFVVDLNRQQFPEGRYDVVTFLGVLEYLHDPAWALVKARETADRLVVSYCSAAPNSVAYRRAMGWVNEYSEEAFADLLQRSDWSVVARFEYKKSANGAQYIWDCTAVAGDPSARLPA